MGINLQARMSQYLPDPKRVHVLHGRHVHALLSHRGQSHALAVVEVAQTDVGHLE